MKNNFEKLEEDLIEKNGNPPEKVKKNIEGSIGILRIFGDIFDMFIPKMIDLFISISGGKNKDSNNKKQEL